MSFEKVSNVHPATDCEAVRAEFSAYLDNEMSGVEMGAIAQHLEICEACASEFAELRSMQAILSDLNQPKFPEHLQAQISEAIAVERQRGSHLSVFGRFTLAWQEWMGAAALRFSVASAAAIIMLGGAAGIVGGVAVQANDDAMAKLVSPRYMYSQVPPRPLETGHEVPVLVDAQVDADGRVYDYEILEGPKDPSVELRVQENLLSSVFRPATAFGVPVPGHVIMTYSGVSVRG